MEKFWYFILSLFCKSRLENKMLKHFKIIEENVQELSIDELKNAIIRRNYRLSLLQNKQTNKIGFNIFYSFFICSATFMGTLAINWYYFKQMFFNSILNTKLMQDEIKTKTDLIDFMNKTVNGINDGTYKLFKSFLGQVFPFIIIFFIVFKYFEFYDNFWATKNEEELKIYSRVLEEKEKQLQLDQKG